MKKATLFMRKIVQHSQWLTTNFAATLKNYPVELLLTLSFYISYLATETPALEKVFSERILPLFPLLFLFTLAVNRITTSKFRIGYYLTYLLPFLLLLLPCATSWILFLHASLYVLPLLSVLLFFLISSKATQNEPFILRCGDFIREGAFAAAITGILAGSIALLYQATLYIFNLDHQAWEELLIRLLKTAFFLILPILFLLYKNNEDSSFVTKALRSEFFAIVRNYILIPSWICYTALLNLYILLICFRGELPREGVALIILGYLSLGAFLQATLLIQPKAFLGRIFTYLSLLSLPALSLFWVGTLYRINAYGFTQNRILLFLLGIIFTAYLLLFFRKNRYGYHLIGLLAFLLFAPLSFVPALSSQRLGNLSQLTRAQTLWETLRKKEPIVDSENPFAPLTRTDTLSLREMHELYEAIYYLEHNNGAQLIQERLYSGFRNPTDFCSEFFPPSYFDYQDAAKTNTHQGVISLNRSTSDPFDTISLKEGKYEYFADFYFSGDSLKLTANGHTLYALRIDTLLQRNIARLNLPIKHLGAGTAHKYKKQLLQYQDQKALIIFNSLIIDLQKQTIQSGFVQAAILLEEETLE